MLLKPTILIACALLGLSEISSAACSKEDIAFYLEKGFSQDQITQLCAAAGSGEQIPDYQPYQQQVIIYSDQEAPGLKGGFTREERVAINDLKKGLDLSGLEIDHDQFTYSHEICLTAQHGKEHDQRVKVCPEVLFELSRTNLRVVSTGKKFGITGKESITLEGNIKRTPQEDLDKLPTAFKQDLIRQYNWKAGGNQVTIPIRREYSLSSVVDAFNALSKQPDSDDVIEQEEKIVEDTPTTANLSAEEKDKKWWNPFD